MIKYNCNIGGEKNMNSTIFIIFAVFIIVFISIIVIAINVALKKEKQIYQEGIEVDSVVNKVEHYYYDHDLRYRCYVKYIGDDNLEHNALLNVRSNLPIGRKVRIKFLPGKYDEAVFVSQEID